MVVVVSAPAEEGNKGAGDWVECVLGISELPSSHKMTQIV